jgi:FMN phosphatase YigB (HAD superfamily)
LSAAIEQAKALPLCSTLVVFDIDDTLLTATEFFGITQIAWFIWLGISMRTQENANKSFQSTATSSID